MLAAQTATGTAGEKGLPRIVRTTAAVAARTVGEASAGATGRGIWFEGAALGGAGADGAGFDGAASGSD